MSEIARGVTRIVAPLRYGEADHVNCYLLDTTDGRVLVDTGMRGSEQAVDAAVAAGVDRVLLTHGHPDHAGLACRYADRVLGHPDVERSLHHRDGLPPDWEVTADLRPLLDGYAQLTLGAPAFDHLRGGEQLGEWEVLDTPGHAPGHISLYRADDGLLIAGDALVPTVQVTAELPDPVAAHLRTADLIAELAPRLTAPGHGDPLPDATSAARRLGARHARRLEEVAAALTGTPRTVLELCDARARRASTETRLRAELQVHAYLEHLRAAGRARAAGGAWISA